MPHRDWYQVLGLARTATPDEIRSAYRRLARELHPDQTGDPASAGPFREATEAYEVLSEPSARARYDRDVPVRTPRGGDARTAGGASASQTIRVRVTRSHPMPGTTTNARRADGPGHVPRPRAVPGVDREIDLAIDLTTACRGGPVRIQLPGGPGTAPSEITIDVPPGTVEGSSLRVAGCGRPGIGGGPSGDLVARVRLVPDRGVRVDGRDLHLVLPVTPWEATLGVTTTLETPAGPRSVTVPPGMQPGTVLACPGEGIANPDGPAGDLHIEVAVVIPTHLEPAERELWRRLGRVSTDRPRATLRS